MASPLYSVETYGELNPYLSFEWLLTNGLGGFASSTVVGCNARRYHGLLVAATTPPVGRVMGVNRIGEILTVDDKHDRLLEFSVNQFRNSFHPRGDQYLRKFELGDVARFEYDVEGVKIVKEVLVAWQRNITGVRYTVNAGTDAAGNPRQARLQLLPFVSLRDFHSLRSAGNAHFTTDAFCQEVAVTEGQLAVYLQADGGEFEQRADWWYGHTYAIEAERGQDDTEDLFCPGAFVTDIAGTGSVTIWIGIDPPGLLEWDEEVAARPRTAALFQGPGIGERIGPAVGSPDPSNPMPAARQRAVTKTMERLARAASDFVVRRKQPDGMPGQTVIAGYPWFADWGRDTMISFPGMFLTTGRFVEGLQVLSVFAQYVSEGMIPNRFDDYTNEPSYNTVDASLWFVHTVHEYLRLSGDQASYQSKLRPACQKIIDGYKAGTRFGIKMDPADGLIAAGDESTQLTWMDAKCGGIAFTPRQGKAIEINALWYNALKLMGDEALAATVAENFTSKFWNNNEDGCFDVVNDQHGANFRDGAIRPNQIFAASLPFSPLSQEQCQAVVDVVRRELLTPFGLRTLSRRDSRYQSRYAGPQMQRDQAYHNGAVWPWLIGHFLDAYLLANGRSDQAMRQAKVWLQPLLDSMDRGCIGQIAEIFEGDEPHRPVGCFAQAWSVAEVLRLAAELGM